MVGKALGVLVPVGMALLVASQWADIVRYLKIRELSQGRGHPEAVPAEGRRSYPQATRAPLRGVLHPSIRPS